MTLGEKIKKSRKEKGLTQSMLVGDYMTRNMLSCIENGTASPSLDTLIYISARLDLPIAYFLSSEESPTPFMKAYRMPRIKEHFKNAEYSACIDELEKLGAPDDETALLLTECYMKLGRSLLMSGEFKTAGVIFEKSLDFSKKTIYNTAVCENRISLYLALCKNIQAPLLEFDQDGYKLLLDQEMDFEFYKYVTLDHSYNYKNETYSLHLKAKRLLKENKYNAALEILDDIVENKRYKEYNSYVMFWIYFDMENAYRRLMDFKNAYKYASKRLSILEGGGS